MNDRPGVNPAGQGAQPSQAQPSQAQPAKPAVGKPVAAAKPRPPRGKIKIRSTAEELDILIRARYPIIYLVSWEEERVEQCLAEIAERRKKKLSIWTLTQGLVKYGAEPQRNKGGAGSTTDPLAALDAVLDQVEPTIFLFKDFHPFMEENRANLAVVRRLRT